MSIETMTKIATYTVSAAGGDSSVTFSNIPQTYTDLKLLLSVRTTYNTWLDIYMSFNGNASSGYSYRRLQGDGGSVTSNNSTATGAIVGNTLGTDSTSSTFSSHSIDISNYTSSNYKSVSFDSVTENNATTAFSSLVAGLSTTTAGITSITFTLGANNYAQHSTFTLYGVRNARRAAGNSIKATGGSISFDGTYVVHTFTSSGTFTPTVALPDVDYLVVAGGGGGGYQQGGGGGAGGLRSTVTNTGGGGALESKISLSPSNFYSIIVGAGAAGATSSVLGPLSGSNSAISGTGISITSIGGGGGASNSIHNGASGGSGGGAGPTPLNVLNTGGAGTSGQGYAGGSSDGRPNSYGTGAGGGGAGAVGQSITAGNFTVGGNGGNGVAVAITGSSITYAGGGGGGAATIGSGTGGTGGSGGGGNGTAVNATGGSAAINTGSGGGGGGQTGSPPFGNGGNGGSGIVIIRYKA